MSFPTVDDHVLTIGCLLIQGFGLHSILPKVLQSLTPHLHSYVSICTLTPLPRLNVILLDESLDPQFEHTTLIFS